METETTGSGTTDSGTTDVDVVVVGGGPAGLSGAVALLRSRRSVLVLDDGAPRNRYAAHLHNYLGREGEDPAALLADGRATVESHGGEVRPVAAVSATSRADDVELGGFEVALADGSTLRTRRLLVTTGLVDELPDVGGLAERWGRDVLHCPYCHGYEVRDQRVVVLASTSLASHGALLFRQLTDDVTVVVQPGTVLAPEDVTVLTARGVTVVDGPATQVVVEDDRLVGMRLASGEVVDADALVVAPSFTARSGLLESLGLTAEPLEMAGQVIGRRVPSGPTGATSVPGLWLAGNVTDPMAQVVVSAGQGLMAGAHINGDLVAEEARLAVAALAGTRTGTEAMAR